jgi:DMSO/TMAO reductase YedYZ molybdopterin-dependent catalytic subunit
MSSTISTSQTRRLARSCTGAALLRPMSARSPLRGWVSALKRHLVRPIAICLSLTMSFVSGATALPQARHSPTAGPSAGTGLVVTGAVAQDLKLSLDDLRKLPRKSVTTKGHDDQMHQYDGVPIEALLAKAGVPQGSALQGKSMALTVVAEGTDGYRAAFSLAELDDDFAAETVLIVDSIDGQPLSPDQGPLRLIVPGDKRPARSVRMLKSVTVVNLSGTAN